MSSYMHTYEDERWSQIGDSLYDISDHGRARSWNRRGRRREFPRPIRPRPDKLGRLSITVCNNGPQRKVMIHHAVLEAFVAPRPPVLEGCHNDGDLKNNHYKNLRWDTHKNNLADRYAHGTHAHGMANGMAVLSEEAVADILSSPLMGVELAKKYAVSPGHICNIRKRKRRVHTAGSVNVGPIRSLPAYDSQEP